MGLKISSASCLHRKTKGFTLIEIMLVMVIMAVMAAMVAPSFFAASSPSAHEQARRLAQALRLAVDEAALTGRPLRWVAQRHSYGFESLDAEGAWQPVTEPPFSELALPAGIMISAVDPAHVPLQEDIAGGKQKEAILAHLLLPPQGLMEAVEITLTPESDTLAAARIRLQPGPGGIRIVRKSVP